MSSETLEFTGCNFFRLRLAYSILSGRPIRIVDIRKSDDRPGIRDFEAKLIGLLEKVTNGTKVEISRTGTQVIFRPGMITGGVVNVDCGINRCISYFLEPLILLSPFCKLAMTIKLKGVTNSPGEISVDGIKAGWLKVYNKFVLNDEKLDIKIQARGLKPDGGGVVVFTAPIVKTLRPVKRQQAGKVCKIRGQAYVTKVTPSLAYRMIDSAKKAMHGYISDVFIAVDQRKGDAGGVSPGYGLFLTAETTEGVIYQAEALSRPKGEVGVPILPEDIGTEAGHALLQQIYMGGALDSSAQVLASTFMTLCPKDVSHFLYGPLPVYSVHVFRHLKQFFEIEFKMEDWRNVVKEEEADMRIGSADKVMITAVGMKLSLSLTERMKRSQKKAMEFDFATLDGDLCKTEIVEPESVSAATPSAVSLPSITTVLPSDTHSILPSVAPPVAPSNKKQTRLEDFFNRGTASSSRSPHHGRHRHHNTPNKHITAERERRNTRTRSTKPKKADKVPSGRSKQKKFMKVLHEIILEKLKTENAIPKIAFRRVVQQIMETNFPEYQIQQGALDALQLETEMMGTKMFKLSGILATHAKRQTLKRDDIVLLKDIFEVNRDGCRFAIACVVVFHFIHLRMSSLMDAEVWDFFCKRLPLSEEGIQEEKDADSELEWIIQTEQMQLNLISATVSRLEDTEVLVKIPLMTNIFELTLRKSDDFPNSPPALRAEYVDGFDSFAWNKNSSLLELTEKFIDFCRSVDEAILEIKDAGTDGFEVTEMGIDEDESTHLMKMSYTVGPVPKNDLEKKEIHSIPCRLQYTGPAEVSGNFIREQVEGEKCERGMFRGRGLEGADWKAPEGYTITVLKERKGPKGVMLDIESRPESIKVWQWDRTCGEDNADRTAIGRASAYLRIAQSLVDD
ncbi:unnamed protein product [Caenorhabditis sp. 36 PRJEB53466]|nr:unnamed protein product [Caenorhabditis sp. 36 PRJEB53466]